MPTATPTLLPDQQGPSSTPSAQAQSATLTVMAAASLTASFTELGQVFEAAHPGIKVQFNFAGSQQLEQQLNEGAPADVFASASTNTMDAAVQAGRVAKDAPKIFVENKLVVIYPVSNPGGITKLQDLAKPGLKLDLADKSVPVGAYTMTFLALASTDPAFGPSFQSNVEKNVVSYEDNVKGVVTKIALNEADAGICYPTDITSDVAGKLGKLDIPDALNVTAVYPIATVADNHNPALAQAFVDLVLSSQGQQIMGKYGFIPTNP